MKASLKTVYFWLMMCAARAAAFFGWSGGPVVLMYHAINTEGGKLSVPPSVFRSQMEYLKRKKILVPLDDIFAHYRGEKKLPRHAIAVTIDDGYLDTYKEAFPILQKYRIPFTVFLTTHLAPLPALGHLPRPSWDQLREMSAAGLMTLGLHGHDHRHISEIVTDPPALHQELNMSSDIMTKETGKPPQYYAYAYGVRDVRVLPHLKELGIQAAFGITDGVVGKRRDVFALPRVQIDRTMSMRLFAYRTTPGVEFAFLFKRFLQRWVHV